MKNVFLAVMAFALAAAVFGAPKGKRGEGLTLAVSAPAGRNLKGGNEWILQFWQDSLTGKMAKYSKMKIVDRMNEKMIIAEQKIAESAAHDDADIVEMGKITNARLVVVGSVQELSAGFSLNFRVNDIETNEVKAAYEARVPLSSIESGEAVNACVLEIFAGLGVQLTDSERAALSATDTKDTKAVEALAKGDMESKNGNLISAMSYFVDAKQDAATAAVASASIKQIFSGGTIDVKDAKAQIAARKEVIAKWEKIFADLDEYRKKNLIIVVYSVDDSTAEPSGNGMKVTVKPGAKVFYDRKVLDIIYNVYKEYNAACAENDWLKSSKIGRKIYIGAGTAFSGSEKYFRIWFGLFDESGYRVKEDFVDYGCPRDYLVSDYNPKSQQGLFNDAKFRSVEMRLWENEVNSITGDVSINFTECTRGADYKPRVYTLSEWEQYMAGL